MPSDRERWNAKYGAAKGAELRAADPFVVRCIAHLAPPEPGARALDLASGTGRHAFELARAGFAVEAWDVSDVALERVAARADRDGLPVATRRLDVAAEAWGDARFDLVVIANFLDRPVIGRLAELVRPGGHVCFTTFTMDWEGAKPPPAFRLKPGELEEGVRGFETLEVVERGGRGGLFGRRPDPTAV